MSRPGRRTARRNPARDGLPFRGARGAGRRGARDRDRGWPDVSPHVSRRAAGRAVPGLGRGRAGRPGVGVVRGGWRSTSARRGGVKRGRVRQGPGRRVSRRSAGRDERGAGRRAPGAGRRAGTPPGMSCPSEGPAARGDGARGTGAGGGRMCPGARPGALCRASGAGGRAAQGWASSRAVGGACPSGARDEPGPDSAGAGAAGEPPVCWAG
jgi:hypothetical protein